MVLPPPPSIRESSVRFKLFSMFKNATENIFASLNGSVLIITAQAKERPIRSKAMRLHIVSFLIEVAERLGGKIKQGSWRLFTPCPQPLAQTSLLAFDVLAYNIKKTKKQKNKIVKDYREPLQKR